MLLLFFTFLGCKSIQYNQKVNELVREANVLLEQGTVITNEWKTEFVKVFTPENRAKFPSNREMLRPHAENQIRLLERLEILSNGAADKFDQASQISNNEKEKKFTSLFAASFRKDVEVSQLFKEQMKLVLDDNIKDLKTFETKFVALTKNVEMKMKERDELQSEGKRIIGR
jgi:TPP-dependent 2-oxoacid decarboxylase